MLLTDVLCYDSKTGRIAFFASDGNSTLQQPAALTTSWETNLIVVPGKFTARVLHPPQGVYSDLFIYNRTTGVAGFYSTDGAGNRSLIQSSSGHTWTHIVAGIFSPNGFYTDLICYDQGSGLIQFYSTDGIGNLNPVGSSPSSHWTHLVPGFFHPDAQTMDVLCYDASSGNAAFYSVSDGNMTLIKNYAGWPLTWSLIVAGTFRTGGATDDLLFYDATQSRAVFQSTDGAGGLAVINTANWGPGISNIVPGYFWFEMMCSGLLVYTSASDVAQMQFIEGQANTSLLSTVSPFGGWTDIVAAKFLNSGVESWRNFDEPTLTRVEAYATSDSVSPGGAVGICIEAERIYRGHYFFNFSVSIRRCGVPDFTFGAVGLAPPQKTPPDAATVGCGWRVSLTIPVPSNCRSGVYLAFVSTGNLMTRVPFIVRPGIRKSRILLAIGTPTMQAYNGWGGHSFYDDNPAGSTRGPVVSYDRPHAVDNDPALMDKWRGILCLDLLNWLELNNGFAPDCCTLVDLHFGTVDLPSYSVVIFNRHSEYWSLEMRTNVESFLAAGGNAMFLCGNTCWWQVRLDDTGRLLTCYKYINDHTFEANGKPTADPFAASSDPNQVRRSTIYWWDDRVGSPEISLTGLTFLYGWAVNLKWPPTPAQGYTVAQPDSWVFKGTNLIKNDVFGHENGIIGSEVDSAFGLYPDGSKFGNKYWSFGFPTKLSGGGSPKGFVELAYCDLYCAPGWNISAAVDLTIFAASGNTVTVSDTSSYTGGRLVQATGPGSHICSIIEGLDSTTNTLTLADSGLPWQMEQPAQISQSMGWASMGIFQYQNGGFVFNAGTMLWTLGLDPLNATAVSKITLNVITRLSVRKRRALPWLSLLLGSSSPSA